MAPEISRRSSRAARAVLTMRRTVQRMVRGHALFEMDIGKQITPCCGKQETGHQEKWFEEIFAHL